MPLEGESPRAIGDICLEEIAAAALLCVRGSFGIVREDLIIATARVLGYAQTGARVRERIEEALEVLAAGERVQVNDDAFVVA